MRRSKNTSTFPSVLYAFRLPSTHTYTNLQSRRLGGPSELGGVGNAPTAGCGSALTWLVIGPDPEPTKVGRIQMNPQGLWLVNLTRDRCLWVSNHTKQGHCGWSYWPWTVTSFEGREKRLLGRVIAALIGTCCNYKTGVILMMPTGMLHSKRCYEVNSTHLLFSLPATSCSLREDTHINKSWWS